MVENCDSYLNEYNTYVSANFAKQQITQKNQDIKTIQQDHDHIPEHSKKVITKLRKIIRVSTLLHQEKQKSSDTYNNESNNKKTNTINMTRFSLPLSLTNQSVRDSQINLGSMSNRDLKLKGILKNTTKTRPCVDLTTKLCNNHAVDQHSKSGLKLSPTIHGKDNNDGFIPLDNNYNKLSSISISPIPIKRVSFSDDISMIKCESNKPIFYPTELSIYQQMTAQQFQ